MKIPRYKKLAKALISRNNCISSKNEKWLDKWNKTISLIMLSAPSGSGFNNGTSLNYACIKDPSLKLVFNTSFQHMNENGYYDGWTDHQISVSPDLAHELGIHISGSNRNDIKEYIADLFFLWLTEEIEEFDNHE